jgi:carbon storage regulator
MLVLSRKLNEEILIGENIRIKVVMIRGNQVRLGIEAPGDVTIIREELRAGVREGSGLDRAPANRDGDEPTRGARAPEPVPGTDRPAPPPELARLRGRRPGREDRSGRVAPTLIPPIVGVG